MIETTQSRQFATTEALNDALVWIANNLDSGKYDIVKSGQNEAEGFYEMVIWLADKEADMALLDEGCAAFYLPIADEEA